MISYLLMFLAISARTYTNTFGYNSIIEGMIYVLIWYAVYYTIVLKYNKQ